MRLCEKGVQGGGKDFMLETQENGYLLKFQERLSSEIIVRRLDSDVLSYRSIHEAS
jgi:hypothetical protein